MLNKDLNIVLLISEAFIIGNTDKMKIPNNNAKTPPILFGIDLKIALKSRKYHSEAISQHNYFLTIH